MQAIAPKRRNQPPNAGLRRARQHLLFGIAADEYSCRGLVLLALLYFGSLLSGAVISLVAYRITLLLDPDLSSSIAQNPYTRFFDRGRWLSVLILLPFLFARTRLTSLAAIRLSRPVLAPFGKWFLLGLGMIGLFVAACLASGAFALPAQTETGFLARHSADALGIALLVAIPEEIVFRGLVFRMFYSAMRPIPAILLSSVFFALLHLKPPASVIGAVAPADIGLREAGILIWGSLTAVVTQFDLTLLLTIFLAGVALHLVFLLRDTLWANIGLHAGWVCALKFAAATVVATPAANRFSGTVSAADGYAVSLLLIALVASLCYLLSKKRSRSTPADAA